jgi:CubicO group peptidase (beta-lactamase class C family)
VPDPLRRCRVPRDLDSVTTVAEEEDPAQVGMTRDGVERIWDAVRGLYRSGVHPAVQLCVRRKGVVVLDRAIGHAKGNGPQDPPDAEKTPATPETPFCIFSASKAITAVVVHLLDERGLLHISDPVAEYLPAYAAHGKETITIAHVLTHKAGVPNLPREALDLEYVADTDRLVKMLCDAKPRSRAGKTLAYHAVSGGFILGEVVRAVTGKGIREVLAQEILDPLGFRWTNYGVAPEDIPQVGINYVTGPPALPPLSTLLTRGLGTHPDEITRLSNDPRFLTAIMPAANGVSTGHELARFFELLRRGGELDGVRVLEPRTLRRALTEQSYLEVDYSLGFPTRFSYGFMLGGKILSLYGPDTQMAFGHLGFVNILGWADPERAISVGLITSGKPTLYPELPQFWGIGWRIGTEASKVEGGRAALVDPPA